MGGYGSGWRGPSVKRTVAGFLRLDVRGLHRLALLVPGKTFSWRWTRNDRLVESIYVSVGSDKIVLPFLRDEDGNTAYVTNLYIFRSPFPGGGACPEVVPNIVKVNLCARTTEIS